MTTYAEVRQGLADAVNAGTGLRAFAYGEADTINAPCAMVVAAETDPRLTFGDTNTHDFFKVQVFVRATSTRAAVESLDEFRTQGPRSMALAVADGDNWTDNLVHYAQVQLIGPVLEATPAGGQERYLMTEYDVEVVW